MNPKKLHLPNVYHEAKKKYHRYVNKTISIITFNPADNQHLHIQSTKKPPKMWKIYCNIYKIGSLSRIWFINNNLFTCKLQEGLICWTTLARSNHLEVLVRNENIVMTLLKSLSPSYEQLIIILEIMHKKKLTMEYVTVFWCMRCPKGGGTKRKKRNSLQIIDIAMVLHHEKIKIHPYAKIPRHVNIVVNLYTLHIFVIRQRTGV